MSGAATILTENQQGILFSKKFPAIKHHYLGTFPVCLLSAIPKLPFECSWWINFLSSGVAAWRKASTTTNSCKAVLLTCLCLLFLPRASSMPALDPFSVGNHSLTTDGINNHFPKQIKRQNPLQPFPLGAIPTFQMPHAKQVLPSVFAICCSSLGFVPSPPWLVEPGLSQPPVYWHH